MNRRDFLKCTGTLGKAALLGHAMPARTVSASSKPNILFFFIDDMGWQDTSEPFYKEVTDLNRRYLEEGRLRVVRLGRGIAWLDTGTPTSLLEASTFIYTIEARQGLKIACPEEIAFRLGYIGREEFAALIEELPPSSYAEYLTRVLHEDD